MEWINGITNMEWKMEKGFITEWKKRSREVQLYLGNRWNEDGNLKGLTGVVKQEPCSLRGPNAKPILDFISAADGQDLQSR